MVPRIHLMAPAGALWPFLSKLSFSEPRGLVDLAREAIGPAYEVTADERILVAEEDERRGGRMDDEARARDLQAAFEDDRTAAVVSLRGGAWLTRILPRIDFRVLDRRTRCVAMIGFSELTSLVNIVGAHPRGLGVYDLSPAFLTYGLRRPAEESSIRGNVSTSVHDDSSMRERWISETVSFFRHVIAMIEGREEPAPVPCTLVEGSPADELEGVFVGGNLTVLSTLVGSPYATSVDPCGRWVVLEDFNDKPERIDRFLAHFTLAGYWERCAGLLLGDFHLGERNLRETVLAMLPYHGIKERSIPVLTTERIGHVWPMTPLPLHRPLRIRRSRGADYTIDWPAALTRIV